MHLQDQRSQVIQANNDSAQVHKQAIERVILTMRSRLPEPLSLRDLADIAHLSLYHFCRVFHHMTGVPPGEFLTALRLDAAKRLLLTTSMSVTDICFEVGYSSLGSFTTHFTRLVGMSPGHLRQLAGTISQSFQASTSPVKSFMFCHVPYTHCFAGRVDGPANFAGVIFVGLFPRPIPQGKPAACLTLSAPGTYLMTLVPDGRYYVLSAAFPCSNNQQTYLMPDKDILIGMSRVPVDMHQGRMRGKSYLSLRPPCLTDPPVLVTVPLLEKKQVRRSI